MLVHLRAPFHQVLFLDIEFHAIILVERWQIRPYLRKRDVGLASSKSSCSSPRVQCWKKNGGGEKRADISEESITDPYTSICHVVPISKSVTIGESDLTGVESSCP